MTARKPSNKLYGHYTDQLCYADIPVSSLVINWFKDVESISSIIISSLLQVGKYVYMFRWIMA